jgi:hypothetical protein
VHFYTGENGEFLRSPFSPVGEFLLDDAGNYSLVYRSMSSHKQDELPSQKLVHLLLDHQRWLNSQGRFGKQLDQSDLCFSDMDLSGFDFSFARLPYAVFEGGSVRGARFVGAILPFAAFYGCDVAETNFSQADLQWTAFDTNHEQAIFTGANVGKTAWTREDGGRNTMNYVLHHLLQSPACD